MHMHSTSIPVPSFLSVFATSVPKSQDKNVHANRDIMMIRVRLCSLSVPTHGVFVLYTRYSTKHNAMGSKCKRHFAQNPTPVSAIKFSRLLLKISPTVRFEMWRHPPHHLDTTTDGEGEEGREANSILSLPIQTKSEPFHKRAFPMYCIPSGQGKC
jgi:hypothetical protein